MPRQRFLNMPAKARGRLLDLALKEFAERGFEEASLNEILTEVGLSKGAYYYYFDDKEDLFATAVEHATDGILSRIHIPPTETLTRENFWPTVEACAGQWVEEAGSSMSLLRTTLALSEARRKNPRLAPACAKSRFLWRMLVEQGQRVGCVRGDVPVDVLVRLLEATDIVLDTAMVVDSEKVTRADLAKHVRLLLDVFRRLLDVAGPVPVAPAAPSSKRGRRG